MILIVGACGTRSGQKHQRREKQAQHLENSAELSHSAVAAVLSDGEHAHPEEHACNLHSLTEEAAGKTCNSQLTLLCSNWWLCLNGCLMHLYKVSKAPLRSALEALPGCSEVCADAGDAEVQGNVDLESNDSSSAHTDPSLAEAETVYREMEFQGCGVPSAFADPGAFDSDDAEVAAEEDRLTDLPKLPLQMRGSGLRVRTSSVA